MRFILNDWRENWRRYVRNGIILFLFVQAIHYFVEFIAG